jgi:hypothetical protein
MKIETIRCNFPNENCGDRCCRKCDSYEECKGYGFSCEMTEAECKILNGHTEIIRNDGSEC